MITFASPNKKRKILFLFLFIVFAAFTAESIDVRHEIITTHAYCDLDGDLDEVQISEPPAVPELIVSSFYTTDEHVQGNIHTTRLLTSFSFKPPPFGLS
jgi:hypothetical protein